MIWGQFSREAGAMGGDEDGRGWGGTVLHLPSRMSFIQGIIQHQPRHYGRSMPVNTYVLSFWLDCSFSQFTLMKRSVLVQTVVLTGTWWQQQVPASEENQPQQPDGGKLSSSKTQLQLVPSEPQLPSSSWVYGEDRRLKQNK